MNSAINKLKTSGPFIFALIWFLFTISLCSWWAYFAYTQVERLTLVDHSSEQELVKFQKMLLYEGTTLFFLLILGSVTFIYQAGARYRQSKRLEEFYLTLSHDIKTPLAGIQLQADLLNELTDDPKIKSKTAKIFESLGRLSVQLENSLFFSALTNRGKGILLNEKCSLNNIITGLLPLFPQLTLQLPDDVVLLADNRALRSIIQNIFQNAVQHGKSKEVVIGVKSIDSGLVELQFTSKGEQFSGVKNKLGTLFTRHYSGSGSGVGLYLIKKLALAMNGSAQFETEPGQFNVILKLKKG